MGMDSSENGHVGQLVPDSARVVGDVESVPDESLVFMERGGAGGEGAEREVPRPADPVSEQELKGIIEALLFVSCDPLPLDKFTAVLTGHPKVAVHNALKALQEEYDRQGRGLHVAELAGGFIMMTQPDYAPWIARLNTVKASARVSRSALETLAIIAYKQPIVRADVERIRGVDTTGVLRTLLEQKLIRIVGRQDIPGRPILYGTSKVFLRKFGLRDLQDLPSLRDFKELGQRTDFFDGELTADGTVENGGGQVEMPMEANMDSDEQPVADHLNASID